MSEPPHAVCDQARELSVAGDSEKKRMLYPYIDRLAYCLRRFLALPGPYQIEIVIGVTEGRVPWRGDAIAMYRLIGKEAARAREVGIDEYRKDARAMAKGAIKKMT